jgi:hypothetical protein
MTVELIEVEPNRWRVKREQLAPARSGLPCPHVISDIMEPTEQVDGRYYTSKAQFRAVGRAHGLTEVGNERRGPKRRATDDPAVQAARRAALKNAVEKYKAGHRPK